MKPYFENNDRQAALWDVAQQWLGTPFFARAAVCGEGVDCVNLVHELLVTAGAIPRLVLPDYTLDRARHVTDSLLLRFLLTEPALAGRSLLVPPAAPRLPGDLIACKSGLTDHHLSLALPWGKAIHAIERQGVILTPLDDAQLVRRTLYVLRIFEAV
ncbi:hypothetical protein OpiT1DRAFT_03957 [Opitutaceae bacterium TAV1]|nr:hypothetical protein OpiT1DRAFT_03957 [Opitutaceae bacterium TAV1]